MIIFRLRVFDRKKKSGIAPTHGIRPSSQSKPTLPAIRVNLPLGHADVPRFPHDIGAERRRGDVADDRNEVEDHVEADRLVDAGDDEQPLEQLLHRLDPLPYRLRVGAELWDGKSPVTRNGHVSCLPTVVPGR